VTKTQTILLVDDEQDVLEALNREFRRFKFHSLEILTANSAEAALKMLNLTDKKIHTIIADHKMTGMTGVDLFKEVKIKLPMVRRVLITGYGDTPGLIEQAINDAEVAYFLKKPWKRSALAQALGIQTTERKNWREPEILAQKE
jgi:thioredoxin reductase (NADPH)